MRGLSCAIALLLTDSAASAATVHPIVVTKAQAAGPVFSAPGAKKLNEHGRAVTDNVLTVSSDRKMEAGMYRAGPSHSEIRDRDYGVDEFMLFTRGSVTLTSLDGKVTTLRAGDAVVLPKEWRGTWDTPGYTKYYVIYSRTGAGM